MTTRVLIANIGQRDLALDYEGLSKVQAGLCVKLQEAADVGAKRPKPNLRKWGALLLDHMNTALPFLSAPILDVALSDLATHDALPDRVLLAGTKQENKDFQKGDTFRCAEALIPVLKRDHPGLSCIETYLITSSPNDLNAVLPEYASLCGSVAGEQVYALCTGGTPACNMALSLRSVEFFGEAGTVMHVAENAARPTHLHIGQYLLKQHRRSTLERLAARGDFDAIADDTGYPETIRKLARAAAMRMNFNFMESLTLLQHCNHPAVNTLLEPLLEEGRRLAGENDRKAALAEVYWSALLKWRRDECADFLGRAMRLMEGSLQDILSATLHFKGGPDKFRQEFEDWTQGPQRENYRSHVFRDITRSKKKNVPETISSTIPALILTVSYLVNYEPALLKRAGLDAAKAGAVAAAVGKMRPLIELRNKSIMAHGFGGVWKKSILMQKNGPDTEEALFGYLQALLNAQDISLSGNPYEMYAHAVVSLNRELNHDTD